MWTVLVNDENAEKFYFEVDIFLPNLPSKRIVYRQVSRLFSAIFGHAKETPLSEYEKVTYRYIISSFYQSFRFDILIHKLIYYNIRISCRVYN